MRYFFVIIIIELAHGINLSHLNLTGIPDNIDSSISDLDLSNNILTILRNNIFANLSQLVSLRLHTNQIHTIESEAFNGLTSLTFLTLVRNRLSSIPDLSVMGALQQFNAGFNPIEILNATKFKGLNHLEYVRLQFVRPSHIIAFPEMPSLISLNLKRNRMSTLSSDVLRRLLALKELCISFNNFHILPYFGGIEYNLTHLDISYNEFSDFPDLSRYISLESLNLSNNHITMIPHGSLSHMSGGTVYLGGNPVTCMSELCWLAAGHWPFDIHLTCSDGTQWEDVDRNVMCDGKSSMRAEWRIYASLNWE